MSEIERRLYASLFQSDRNERALQCAGDSYDPDHSQGQRTQTRDLRIQSERIPSQRIPSERIGNPRTQTRDLRIQSERIPSQRIPSQRIPSQRIPSQRTQNQGCCTEGPRPQVQGQRSPTGLLHKELSYAIVGAAIDVHRHIGPGQLEATYERALCKELARRGIEHRSQVPLEMSFKGDVVGEFYADLIVEGKVIIELKAVAAVHYVHRMQVLSYLRASGLRLGLLINFNVPVLSRGVYRIVL